MTSPHRTPRPSARPVAGGDALLLARERVIALLTDRFADDTITVEEFESRLERLHAARSVAELDLLMVDLMAAPSDGVAQRRHPSPFGATSVGRMIAILGEAKRTGVWAVPQQLDVKVILGDLLIDLREAVLPPGGCDLALFSVLGQIRILVPPGVEVVDQLFPMLTTVNNDSEPPGAQAPLGQRVRLTGTVVLTEITVRIAPRGERASAAWKKAKRRWRR